MPKGQHDHLWLSEVLPKTEVFPGVDHMAKARI